MKLHLFVLATAVCSVIFSRAAELAGMDNTIRQYSSERFTVARAYELPWSEIRFERFEKLYREWQGNLPGIDFDALPQQERIDYILLRNELVSELDRQNLQRERLKEMDELLSFRDVIAELEFARWRLEPLEAQAAATKVSELAERVKKLKERVEKGKKAKDGKKSDDTNETAAATSPKETRDKPEEPPLKVSPSLARRTASAINDLRGTLKTWFSFYDGYQPDFSWWLKKPYDEANTALENYAKYLREEVAG